MAQCLSVTHLPTRPPTHAHPPVVVMLVCASAQLSDRRRRLSGAAPNCMHSQKPANKHTEKREILVGGTAASSAIVTNSSSTAIPAAPGTGRGRHQATHSCGRQTAAAPPTPAGQTLCPVPPQMKAPHSASSAGWSSPPPAACSPAGSWAGRQVTRRWVGRQPSCRQRRQPGMKQRRHHARLSASPGAAKRAPAR